MKKSNHGFMVYIVVTLLLGLAILGLALNRMKMGSVTLLVKTVDQNRLIAAAQSANTEVIAMMRSRANLNSATPQTPDVFAGLRKPFTGGITTGSTIELFNNLVPPKTSDLINEQGFNISVKSKAVLTIHYSSATSFSPAVNGYLGHVDVFSQACLPDKTNVYIEMHERRYVKFVDLRHTFDKYVLFLKKYSPDYNNTRCRINIEGIDYLPGQPNISKVFLGNDDYAKCDASVPESDKNIWLDIYYDEHKHMPGFKDLFGTTTRTKFPDMPTGDNFLFFTQELVFKDLAGNLPINYFYHVYAVKFIFEKFVNQAANALLSNPQPFLTGNALKQKANQAMSDSGNPNSAAYTSCQDFVSKAQGDDYSACTVFDIILNTCIKNWKYHYGYTDANSLWETAETKRPALPGARAWARSLAYSGLASEASRINNLSPYYYEYIGDDFNNPYNSEKARVGQMLSLYGSDIRNPFASNPKPRPVLVEGPVYLRFFKLAYLDTFQDTITLYTGDQTLEPEPVPILYQRKGRPLSFANDAIENLVTNASTNYFDDSSFMSRSIDTVSINALLGSQVTFFDGDGNIKTYNPHTELLPSHPRPMHPSTIIASATFRGRAYDPMLVTFEYPNPKVFLEERVRKDLSGNKTIYIDGFMTIDAGDLDLSDIKFFYGKGLIYLKEGNCKIGNLGRIASRKPPQTSDSLRIYLRQGSFILDPNQPTILIEASLAALYQFDSTPLYRTAKTGMGPSEQGTLVFDNHVSVTIFGNLILDYLYTQGAGGQNSLADGGRLNIIHDVYLYDLGATISGRKLDPYQVTISPVRSVFALNAGGKTF